MRIKINFLGVFLMFYTLGAFSQNAYDIVQRLQRTDINTLKEKITLLTTSEEYKNILPKDEIERLNTFKLFLEQPFSNAIDFDKLMIKKTIVFIDDIDPTLDRDGDGILNSEDPCPNNSGTHGGCPDADGDGVSDALDACPGVAGTLFNKGCPSVSISNKEKKFNKLVGTTQAVLTTNNTAKGTSFSTFSGITPIVDGTAKFLVDRTKKEIALTFFENFTQRLTDSISFTLRDINKHPIEVHINLAELYPSTHTLLVSTDGLSLPSFGETWIVAFKKDLKALPANVIGALKNAHAFSNSEIGTYTLGLAAVIEGLNKGEHPSDIISRLALEFNGISNNTQKAIQLIDVFSKNLTKVVDYEKQWLTTIDFKNLGDTYTTYLLGWIYQYGRSLEIIPTLQVENKLNVFKDKYQYIIDLNSKIQGYLVKLEDIINTSEKQYLLNFIAITDDSVDLLTQTTEQLFSEQAQTVEEIKALVTKIKPISRDVKNLVINLDDKSYGESLLNTISLLKDITNVEDDNALIKNVSFYGNFLVDLVNASNENNSDNVKLILDKYALPVSSYRIKRRSNFSIDVSAYPGISIGYEFSESDSPNFGITAPIGFSFSMKNNREEESSSSSSIFISAIDIGAPFTYRLTNDSAEGLPDTISWEQIFAPGAYYVYGFNKSPFALSFGVQYAPQLRKIETNNVLNKDDVIRVQLGITVDIPIFNLKKME